MKRGMLSKKREQLSVQTKRQISLAIRNYLVRHLSIGMGTLAPIPTFNSISLATLLAAEIQRLILSRRQAGLAETLLNCD